MCGELSVLITYVISCTYHFLYHCFHKCCVMCAFCQLLWYDNLLLVVLYKLQACDTTDSIGGVVRHSDTLSHTQQYTADTGADREVYWTCIATGVTNRIAYIGPCPVSSDKCPTWPGTTLPVN